VYIFRNIILSVCIILLFISSYYIEKQLFYYGEHVDYTFKVLPFNIKPDNWHDYYEGLSLWKCHEEDRYLSLLIGSKEIIEQGDKNFRVKRIIGYYYGENQLIVEVVTDANELVYVKYFESKTDKNEFNIHILDSLTLKEYEELKHISVLHSNEYVNTLKKFRLVVAILQIILILILSFRIIWGKTALSVRKLFKYKLSTTFKQKIREINVLISSVQFFFLSFPQIGILNSSAPEYIKNTTTAISISLLFILAFVFMYLLKMFYQLLLRRSYKTNIRIFWLLLITLVLFPVLFGIFFWLSYLLTAYTIDLLHIIPGP
jgi:hypothetical protein